jgi:hypothetical protein
VGYILFRYIFFEIFNIVCITPETYNTKTIIKVTKAKASSQHFQQQSSVAWIPSHSWTVLLQSWTRARRTLWSYSAAAQLLMLLLLALPYLLVLPAEVNLKEHYSDSRISSF